MGYGGLGTGEYIQGGDKTQNFPLLQRADQLPLPIHEDIGQISVDQMPCPA
jgi:hypothetical protein